ncbi:uncharacterized protein CANTADRAFT_23510 [Suhomyces tanzawaensis NRRL Y-17324]|uniref:RRM domain-containing protein n=1 Tax=Suhomyces tanzawaensis NRRL Y-17324 TaxID=984487 RepID=A0A1E4SD23_9ASCO|nr:uncharacterized protein CANTADRAFT_23510 [Suhomyces tanzawaensis NRRL Y-17324]ODV77383.1 hypothetical protein CANTADRAFT_23510 [Suhomyces tanzawaensis NRRL Y-17324]
MNFGSGTSVSIGKFPFEYSEQQVLDIAKSIGPVQDLKLMFDEMTGKSKGTAIVDYGDHETAASAVRNLNYMALPNGRFLKCAFTDEEEERERLPPLPLGIQIQPNQTASGVISNVANSIDQASALQILKEAKKLSVDNPGMAQTLLEQFPQLSHALVELSLITSTTNRDLIELALNKRKPVLTEVTADHAKLLKDVNNLKEDELEALDESQRKVIEDIKKEISEGTYGQVV